MKNLICVLFLGMLFSQELIIDDNNEILADTLENKNKNFNLSIGFLDSRTGLSLIGLSYDLYKDNRNELFIGGGTALVAFTGSIGLKHYLLDTENNLKIHYEEESENKLKLKLFSSPFLVFSYQYIASLGGIGHLPTITTGYEIRFSKYFSGQLGCNLSMLILEEESELAFFPFLNMNIDF